MTFKIIKKLTNKRIQKDEVGCGYVHQSLTFQLAFEYIRGIFIKERRSAYV